MAVAGGGVPSFPISLGVDGRVRVHSWPSNKPAHLVEQDIDRAVVRLLAGEMFQMHCSGPQISRINEKLKEHADKR